MDTKHIKPIAFYLPQYHPTPENDEWWEKGFTEWTNVSKAKPLFPGHYQPHLPTDLGFYDLRVPEVRQEQAELAKKYGIEGFCYYHYWFNGRRILERPINEILASGQPDFPFCLCWANENWTKTWSGGDKDVLLEQNYSYDDDLAHIRSLLPSFSDPRYIRLNGKPIFLVYRTELLPDPKKTSEIWREEALRQGIGELYLVRVESFNRCTNPQDIGFDAAVEFAPDWSCTKGGLFNNQLFAKLSKFGLFPKKLIQNQIYDYDSLAMSMMAKKKPEYTRFPGITPCWDNSARRSKNAAVFHGSTPDKYEQWLANVIFKLLNSKSDDPKVLFLNAWNEWAEGNHLEPDLKWGHGYLQATQNALVDPLKIRHSLRITEHPLVKFNRLYKKYIEWRFK